LAQIPRTYAESAADIGKGEGPLLAVIKHPVFRLGENFPAMFVRRFVISLETEERVAENRHHQPFLRPFDVFSGSAEFVYGKYIGLKKCAGPFFETHVRSSFV
jgi:hypothetical protein